MRLNLSKDVIYRPSTGSGRMHSSRMHSIIERPTARGSIS